MAPRINGFTPLIVRHGITYTPAYYKLRVIRVFFTYLSYPPLINPNRENQYLVRTTFVLYQHVDVHIKKLSSKQNLKKLNDHQIYLGIVDRI